jgi:hypothetical protein
MNQDQVIFEKTINGKHVQVTVADVFQSDEVAAKILQHGVHRVADSARTNATDKDAAMLSRLKDIKNGQDWKQGGGNSVDARTRMYREHLTAWAEQHLDFRRQDAEKLARQNGDDLLSKLAVRILRSKGEEKPDSNRKAQAAENLKNRILQDVDSALSVEADI